MKKNIQKPQTDNQNQLEDVNLKNQPGDVNCQPPARWRLPPKSPNSGGL